MNHFYTDAIKLCIISTSCATCIEDFGMSNKCIHFILTQNHIVNEFLKYLSFVFFFYLPSVFKINKVFFQD